MSKPHYTFDFTKPSHGDGVRKYLANLFLGLCIIAVGVGYLGNYVETLPWSGFTLFFPGWGALFLMIPAVYFLIRSPFSWFWPVCLLVGVLILISKLEIYPFGTAVAICLSALVILIGIRIILSPLFKRIRRRKIRKKVQETFASSGFVYGDSSITAGDADGAYSVKFGEKTVKMDGQDFASATLSVAFGEMIFDLRGAAITDCAVIDANCSFGELVIHLPDTVRVEVTRSGAFSEIDVSHDSPSDPNAPVVYVNASCSFGEIVVK
jgi:predicted membrane protein